MSKISTNDIKKLREETGAPIMDCKRALEESAFAAPSPKRLGRVGDKASADKSDVNFENAKKILAKWGITRAQKKKSREASEGLVYAYIHGGKIGAMLEVNCETDFVARTSDFQKLARELAMQITSMDPDGVDELLEQAYIRDQKKTIGQLVDEVIAKVGENIKVARFARYSVGG